MLGWEFPPYFAGGVGIVCYELTKSLIKKGVDITYIMPKGPESIKESSHVNMLIADNIVPDEVIGIFKIPSKIKPYVISKKGDKIKGFKEDVYGENIIEEAYKFASKVLEIVLENKIEFDVIHAHDYLTFPAAVLLKKATGKPLIVHVHITQFDITGGEYADPRIYAIEREGMMFADRVITVSNFIKNKCIEKYYIPEEKIRVVYNAITPFRDEATDIPLRIEPDEKIILYLGRVTLQKGPDYFVRAAKKVLEYYPKTKFILAGTGDMLPQVIELAANLGIADKFLFPGFVSREEADMLYKTADLFVMPSVSEPFGIVPLEAMKHGTPVIISKQSGVSEILKNCLRVDFWDVDDIANKIIAALTYEEMTYMMKEHGLIEIKKFSWDKPAKECKEIYEEVIRGW